MKKRGKFLQNYDETNIKSDQGWGERKLKTTFQNIKTKITNKILA